MPKRVAPLNAIQVERIKSGTDFLFFSPSISG